MFKYACAVLSIVIGLGFGVLSSSPSAASHSVAPAAVSHAVAMPEDAQNAFVATNCATCHDDEAKPGGVSLEHFDAAKIVANAGTAERMIRKLRAGMMPPPSVTDRPDAASLDAFATSLEEPLDREVAQHPAPGRRTFQRLNRAEYQRAVRDLLDLDVDVVAFLPGDTVSQGYDNIADVQSFSPTLLQGYLSAATKISALALGDRDASPSESAYKVPKTESQMVHVEGTPWGTRGGIAVVHNFPADGEYSFRVMLHTVPTGQLFGSTVKNEQIEISIDGERSTVMPVSYLIRETDELGMNIISPRVHIKAGAHRVAAAFLQRFESDVPDVLAPLDHSLADTFYGSNNGITSLPHIRDFAITGPFSVTGISETPSRKKILTCKPASASQELPCARRILERLASEAYRRPVSGGDLEQLLKFYQQGRAQGDFESGIRMGLQWILASPRFAFRFEAAPAALQAGQLYRIGDLELASRLSYFLWAAAPDAELVRVATTGGLKTRATFDKQVRRMLADPRSEALSTRFAAQWLRLQDVDKILPDPLTYTAYNYQLAQSFKRETELFFDSIVREDRNVLDLLTADYTFVNERVARHYGIPNVTGEDFHRVQLTGGDLEHRRGLFGQGSILMLTSVANRTSPVQRGKWIMEVLLGSPPPPPPPEVNTDLDQTVGAASGGRLLSTRERMAEHRANPFCASCHRVIDPLGLTLENFDVTGQWRIKDNGVPVDADGVLYDGTKMSGSDGLRQALLSHREPILRTFTENLMKYALGRRVEYFDQPIIRATVKRAAANDYRFSSFVTSIVNSPAFQMSVAETPTRTVDNDRSSASLNGPGTGRRR